ncbi:Hypothetical predicted protein, partial [Pelobates cultripes]
QHRLTLHRRPPALPALRGAAHRRVRRRASLRHKAAKKPPYQQPRTGVLRRSEVWRSTPGLTGNTAHPPAPRYRGLLYTSLRRLPPATMTSCFPRDGWIHRIAERNLATGRRASKSGVG